MVYFNSNFNRKLCNANNEGTYQTPPPPLRSPASDLGLHCLRVTHKKDARLIWANNDYMYIDDNKCNYSI